MAAGDEHQADQPSHESPYLPTPADIPRRASHHTPTPRGPIACIVGGLEPRYDTIGHGYARTRREDPRLRERIHAALDDARIVINVGAGTGSYEPLDRHVVAIEPSDVMAAQRSRRLAPAIRATAADLPLRDGAGLIVAR